MQLRIVDRFSLLGVLPEAGNFVTMKLIADLRSALGFSEDELKEAEIVVSPETGRVSWNGECALMKDVDIGDATKSVVSGALKKLNDENKLTAQLLDIYEQFVGA